MHRNVYLIADVGCGSQRAGMQVSHLVGPSTELVWRPGIEQGLDTVEVLQEQTIRACRQYPTNRSWKKTSERGMTRQKILYSEMLSYQEMSNISCGIWHNLSMFTAHLTHI